VGHPRTGLIAGTLTALLALVVVAGAGALAFADEPCLPTPDAQRCPDGFVDASYSIKLEAKSGGGSGPPYGYILLSGSPPSGIEFRSDGVISGMPTQVGTSLFWVQLLDSAGNKGSQQLFSITINPRLLVTTQTAGPGTTGVPYSLALGAVMKSSPTATSPPHVPPTWSVVNGQLPPGLTLGATDGVISGTPTTEGSYPFVVQAALIDGRSDTKALQIDVRAAVAIAARAVPRSEIGVPFRLALVASGGTGTYTWSLASGALPPGVALGADGTIVGTPRAAGAFRFTATATDTEGRKADYPGALNVAQRLAIATQLLRPAKVGQVYRQKVVTTGGVIPKVLRLTKGPFPRGIRFDRTLGVLSGTPTKPGTYRLTFLAVDALKAQSTKTLKLVVTA
jgi:large repetitive protein